MADITMYGADWCGDCIRSKRVFTELNVTFEYINVDEVPEAKSVVVERNNGAHSIPVIIFPDDSHLTEPSDADLKRKLKELGLA